MPSIYPTKNNFQLLHNFDKLKQEANQEQEKQMDYYLYNQNETLNKYIFSYNGDI